jgi:glycosyltransferase involved in cell wall biosynthesis
MPIERVDNQAENLLCVANFPTNTGYAWSYIESLFTGIADRMAELGSETFVAYPQVDEGITMLGAGPARVVELPFHMRTREEVRNVTSFIRDHGITILYLTDRLPVSVRFIALRRAGVKRIVVHDHTSGQRTIPRGLTRLLKRLAWLVPGASADYVIGVSDYVVNRKKTVDLVPADRIRRIWNSLEPVVRTPDARAKLRAKFGLSADATVVMCACRAVPEKGVGVLLRAFDRLLSSYPAGETKPALIYLGSGPGFTQLEQLHASLKWNEHVILAGYRTDAGELIEGADVCVSPSVWEEAFGLAVLEPMARGIPVIASDIGGIPEVMIDGTTGLLVPPGDEPALVDAMRCLLSDAAERERMGTAGAMRAKKEFAREPLLNELLSALVPAARDINRRTNEVR